MNIISIDIHIHGKPLDTVHIFPRLALTYSHWISHSAPTYFH